MAARANDFACLAMARVLLRRWRMMFSSSGEDHREQEWRFLLSRSATETFLAGIASRLTREVHDPARPVTYARTTYFDTDDLELFRSAEGPVARRVRLREYGASSEDPADLPTLTGAVFLECKESEGRRRHKERTAGRVEALAELASLRVPGRVLAPRMTTVYRRVALTAGEDIRITLDEGVCFCHPTFGGPSGTVLTPVRVVDSLPGRVLEVKVIGEAPAWLTEPMAHLAEATHFSKFRHGMQALRDARGGGETTRWTRPIAIIGPNRSNRG